MKLMDWMRRVLPPRLGSPERQALWQALEDIAAEREAEIQAERERLSRLQYEIEVLKRRYHH